MHFKGLTIERLVIGLFIAGVSDYICMKLLKIKNKFLLRLYSVMSLQNCLGIAGSFNLTFSQCNVYFLFS